MYRERPIDLFYDQDQVNANCDCQHYTNGPVAWWPGEGDAEDVVGSQDGTIVSPANAQSTGVVGQSFDFPGVGSVNVGNPIVNEAPLSCDFWAFAPTLPFGNQYLISNGGETGAGFGFSFSVVNQKWRFTVRRPDGTYAYKETPQAIQTSQWIHLAGTWDGTRLDAGIRLYVDGEEVVTSAVVNSTVLNTGIPRNLVLGRPSTTSSYGWAGQMDEVSIYDKVISRGEIELIHSAGSQGKCQPSCHISPGDVLGWWPGESGANDIGAGNDGTLVNASAGTAGKVGKAFEFSGSNSHVIIPDPITNASPYSVEFWVKPNAVGTQNQYIVTNGGETSARYGFAMSIVNGRWRFTVRNAQGETGFAECEIRDVDGWTHLAGVWDGTTTTNSIKLYVNGTLRDIATASQGPSPTGTPTQLFLGRPVLFSNNYLFSGKLDELTIYDKMLADDVIMGIYLAGSSGKCTPSNRLAASSQIEGKDLSLEIYPNPNQGNFVIELLKEDGRLRIFDMNGRIVMEKYVSQGKENINLATLTKGIYIVKFKGKTTDGMEKIVIW